MKRDWDVIREVLIRIEEDNNFCTNLKKEEEKTYLYHTELLIEAGLVQGRIISLYDRKGCVNIKLTWDGHNFLDAINNDTIWNKTKSHIKEKALSMSFDIIKTVASKFAGEMLQGALANAPYSYFCNNSAASLA